VRVDAPEKSGRTLPELGKAAPGPDRRGGLSIHRQDCRCGRPGGPLHLGRVTDENALTRGRVVAYADQLNDIRRDGAGRSVHALSLGQNSRSLAVFGGPMD
jgi:hypothetical protein